MARKQCPDREIILCADNDCETRKPDGTSWNPGVEAASKAAASIGGKLAICPAIDGGKADFNDLHTRRSLEAVRQTVEKARREDPGVKYPVGYDVCFGGKDPGLYRKEKRGEDYEPVRIAPPLRILGRTKSVGSDNWGTLLQWFDPAGKEPATPSLMTCCSVRGTTGRRLWRIRAIPSAGARPTPSPCSFRSCRQPDS